MTDEPKVLLAKAKRSILAARKLLDDYPEFATARAYYAMFYAAEAVLLKLGFRFHKHSAVHAAFGEHFAKTGRIDPKYHRWLLDAFDERLLCDYQAAPDVNSSEAAELLQRAEEFIEAIEKALK